jgi:hypothetical protein
MHIPPIYICMYNQLKKSVYIHKNVHMEQYIKHHDKVNYTRNHPLYELMSVTNMFFTEMANHQNLQFYRGECRILQVAITKYVDIFMYTAPVEKCRRTVQRLYT